MLKTVERFFSQIIDYAGLFPPAQLDLETAITNYTNYRTSEDAWMLGRFICPAGRLKELQKYRENLFAGEVPFDFSILGSGGRDAGQFLARLEKDLDEIKTFLAYHDGKVTAEVLEVRLPEPLLQAAKPVAVSDFLKEIALLAEKSALPGVTLFYEAAFPENWQKVISAVVAGIAEHNHAMSDSVQFQTYRTAGFKLRCGGTEPHMYPTPEQVAGVIETCHLHQVAMKATAGLHHPVRHFNKTAGVKMHGFLNVFGAAILTAAHDLSRREILEIVADEDPGSFMFTRRAFAWQGLRASTEDIHRARQTRTISFGSCSFDEPREDLVALKIL